MSDLPPRELPAHIAKLLSSGVQAGASRPRGGRGFPTVGNSTDSAGIPWAGRDLSGEGNPLHTFDGDDGLTPPVISEARRRLLAGDADEAGFVNALGGQRLFAPVLATGPGDAEHGDGRLSRAKTRAGSGSSEAIEGSERGSANKEAEISLITLTASDGRTAMPVFTSVQALTDWHQDARPVAAETERVMLAALAEGAELAVLDPGAEHTFVIRRPGLEALAQGKSWTPSYQDQQLAQALAEIPQHCPGVLALQLSPGAGVLTETRDGHRVLGGGAGPELSIGVVVEPGTDEVGARLALAAVQAAVEDVTLLRQRADSVQIVRTSRRDYSD